MDSKLAAGPDLSPAQHANSAEIPVGRLAAFFERAVWAALFVFVIAAPHSIAVTQGAFVVGLVFWLCRMAAERRWIGVRTAVDLPLGIFIAWTVLSVATSLDPGYSLDRLRGVSLFLAMYLFAANVASKRMAWMLTLVLSVSVTGNLALTYYQRAVGSGLKVVALKTDALEKWGIRPGDVIVKVDGQPVKTVDDVNRAFDAGRKKDLTTIRFTRGEYELESSYRRNRIRRDGIGPERLGIETVPGRDFRSRGFFSHPATYAEVLQLIASMIAGWVIVALARDRRFAIVMAVLGVLVAGALVQTQTRAPIVAFGLAVVCMLVIRGASRRGMALGVLAAIAVVAIGAAVVLKGRTATSVLGEDDSTAWRLTVWREAAGILAKHPIFGIGPDAAKPLAEQLQLFENGKLPPGHFHSTPIQIAVDRGLPALAAWLWFVIAFFVAGCRLVRDLRRREESGLDWRVSAAVLGAIGGWIGFIASSFVHFNWGDGEPMELAWALMGIVFAVSRLAAAEDEAIELR